jgi:hypothetical protein
MQGGSKMSRFHSVLMAIAFGAASLAASSAEAVTVSWAGFNSATAGLVTGSINAPSGTVGVTYTGGYSFAQINNTGTDYWIDNGYTQGVVNRPPLVDLIALANGGFNNIHFSTPVTNPYMAFTSWNGNTANFSAAFSIISQGCGYWGCGTFVPNGTNTGFFGNGEVHGVLQFAGTFSDISFTDTSENWHGFTVGIADVANAVPEPSSLALLGAGLAGLGAMRRRRKAKA